MLTNILNFNNKNWNSRCLASQQRPKTELHSRLYSFQAWSCETCVTESDYLKHVAKFSANDIAVEFHPRTYLDTRWHRPTNQQIFISVRKCQSHRSCNWVGVCDCGRSPKHQHLQPCRKMACSVPQGPDLQVSGVISACKQVTNQG